MLEMGAWRAGLSKRKKKRGNTYTILIFVIIDYPPSQKIKRGMEGDVENGSVEGVGKVFLGFCLRFRDRLAHRGFDVIDDRAESGEAFAVLERIRGRTGGRSKERGARFVGLALKDGFGRKREKEGAE
jgi:hypothetical protein